MIAFKKLREKAGYSQLEIAQKLGLSQSTVAMWETGKNSPRTDTLPALAELLGCAIDDLFTTNGGDRTAYKGGDERR